MFVFDSSVAERESLSELRLPVVRLKKHAGRLWTVDSVEWS